LHQKGGETDRTNKQRTPGENLLFPGTLDK